MSTLCLTEVGLIRDQVVIGHVNVVGRILRTAAVTRYRGGSRYRANCLFCGYTLASQARVFYFRNCKWPPISCLRHTISEADIPFRTLAPCFA